VIWYLDNYWFRPAPFPSGPSNHPHSQISVLPIMSVHGSHSEQREESALHRTAKSRFLTAFGMTMSMAARVFRAAPNRGVSSSGDVEQFVEIGGKRYSHIVDPRTGLGLTTRIAVTVIAPDCTTSDALATAISVLGPKKGRALAGSYPGVTCFIN
jgi:hypothetical protein